MFGCCRFCGHLSPLLPMTIDHDGAVRVDEWHARMHGRTDGRSDAPFGSTCVGGWCIAHDFCERCRTLIFFPVLRVLLMFALRLQGQAALRRSVQSGARTFANIETITDTSSMASASSAWEKSCYKNMEYTISDSMTVFDAVQRFSAYNVGALVTVDDKGKLSGVSSERDYINKIALLGRTSKETHIKAVATMGAANLIVATKKDTIQECMSKMLAKDIRHLPLVDDDGEPVGMLSIKDLIKEVVNEKNDHITRLSHFALGKGGHFVVD